MENNVLMQANIANQFHSKNWHVTKVDLIHLVEIFHHFYKGDNFCDFLFASLCTNTFLKGVYSKKKSQWEQILFF